MEPYLLIQEQGNVWPAHTASLQYVEFSCFDQSQSVIAGIKQSKVVKTEIAAVRIRQVDYDRIQEYQLGIGNDMEKLGTWSKKIIFLALEEKS